MTSKERLDIIKQRVNTIRLNTKIGSRRIADEENAVLLDHIEYNLNEFYKLVERDTPMKPEFTNEYAYNFRCSKCESVIILSEYKKVNFCVKCGQRLDWSNE